MRDISDFPGLWTKKEALRVQMIEGVAGEDKSKCCSTLRPQVFECLRTLICCSEGLGSQRAPHPPTLDHDGVWQRESLAMNQTSRQTTISLHS